MPHSPAEFRAYAGVEFCFSRWGNPSQRSFLSGAYLVNRSLTNRTSAIALSSSICAISLSWRLSAPVCRSLVALKSARRFSTTLFVFFSSALKFVSPSTTPASLTFSRRVSSEEARSRLFCVEALSATVQTRDETASLTSRSSFSSRSA